MKGISKGIFIGLLLIGLNNQLAYSAQDVVKTYHSDWVEAQYFKDGDAAFVTVKDGTTQWGSLIVNIIPLQGYTYTLTLNDMGEAPDASANDGTYTGKIMRISKTAGDNTLLLSNGQQVNIVVDLDSLGDPGTATIIADYTNPEISAPPAVSEEYFSPMFSPGKKDTTLITFKSNEKGRYKILFDDNRIPDTNIGTHTPEGTMNQDDTIYFEWNGFDKYGSRTLEGIHTIKVTVWDEAGNQSAEKTCNVWIDNTPPTMIDISLSDDTFSPRNSPGNQDSTNIILDNEEFTGLFYELSIDTRILQQGTGSISSYMRKSITWGGLDATGSPFDEGVYTINLKAEDLAGNEITKTIVVTIDNTSPEIDYVKDDSGGNICYRNQDIRWTLHALDWIGTSRVTADKGIAIATITGSLLDYGEGIYGGIYTVTPTDIGTFSYTAYFEDKAGNPATNNFIPFGTITLRGDLLSPITESIIVRLGVITPEKGTFSVTSITSATSTMTIKSDKIKGGEIIKITDNDNSHTWVSSAKKDGEVDVSNADIFYGYPVSDYKKIDTSTIREGALLKGKVKIEDDITVNLTAVTISERLSLSSKTTTSAIFEDSRIATGTMVVAYDSTNRHIWLGTASQRGRFTISNANIYFGKLVENYKELGEINGVTGYFAVGGTAFANMGIIVQGITLYDDGNKFHRDIKSGDGIYSNSYIIKEKNDTTSYFYGYFKYADKDAQNNGISSQNQVSIDATPPVITNFGAFPGIFQPGSENVTIKYTLEEKCKVTIEIWDEDNNCIRELTPPDPAYGDNCSADWDGRNDGGVVVKDGTYYYKINATDEAGNKAIERIGIIKASTIDIKITELKIKPSRITPDPDIKGDVDFTVNFHVSVKATEKQLQNVGFLMDTNDIYTLPYLLVKVTAYNAQGAKLMSCGPDLISGIDTDPFTNGYPDYYTGPFGTETGYGRYPKLGTDLPDWGDGDKGNDWDILVPLQRDTENQYYIDWGVNIFDWDMPNGTYLIRVEAKLIGSCWAFIGYAFNAANIPIAEIWHQKPNERLGDYRSSKPVEGRIEVIDSPITKPDYIAPEIIATNPGANTIHEPTENIVDIWAKLMDQGGSGLDLALSTIILKNSIGLVIPGSYDNDGIDTVYWRLNNSLTTPDDYTIEIRPVDKAKNGLSNAPQQFTFTILDRVGPIVDNILYNSTALLKNGDKFGPNQIESFCVTLSEMNTGKSKVDFASSKIMIKKEPDGPENEPHKLFNGSRREEIFTENSGRIIYESLEIAEGGTYTIWVVSYDKSPTPNPTISPKKTFYISLQDYINVEFNYSTLGTRTYLTIPPETNAYTITTTPIIVGSNTIVIRKGSVTVKNENYTVIDPVIEFWWFNSEHIDIKLQPPIGKVIPFTMYYGHIVDNLPGGVTEDNLAIWRYDGTKWSSISGVNDIDKNNNKITINLPEYPNVSLQDQYAIMYLTPKAVDVQYYHYEKKLVTCLKIPEATKVNGRPVGTNTVTAGTLTTTRDGYGIVEPVVQFFLDGQPVANKMEFDKNVTLIMYYTENDVKELTKRGLKEKDLSIYEYDGTNWVKITTGVLNQNNKEITYQTKIIRRQYAIMYVIPTIEEKAEVFEESVYAYPNPTKGRVTFRYELVRDAKITIKIYTMMGDLVWSKEYSSTSPQGKQGSHGNYPATDGIIWDCKNDAGKEIASGLYIYKLTASDEVGEVSVTKKLIVVQ